MKNQIIKKIMAYLLVGAMVITTPMTASAAGLADAYSTGADQGTDNNSDSSTNTNTNTEAIETVIPDEIEKFNYNITGIVLDKDALSFEEISTDEKDVLATLQARVLFDDYDPAGEEMVWASLEYKDKVEIEKQIHWYCDNNKVAKVTWAKNDPKKANVKAVGLGQAKVSVWIEADGQAYKNNPDRPTPGDYIATATVTVTEKVTSIDFEQDPKVFFQKRTYDLKENTILNKGKASEMKATNIAAEKLVYSLDSVSKGSSVTLSEDGILTVKKATSNTKVKFNIVAVNSELKETGEISFGNAIHATQISADCGKSVGLDLGETGYTSKTVKITLENKKSGFKVNADTSLADRNDGSNITDVVTWTTKNSNIADIVPVTVKDENGNVVKDENGNDVTKNDLTREIVAKGVGSTTITATASSGKKATIKVTVTATPNKVKILSINEKGEEVEGSGSTWTGKRTTLNAVLIATVDGKEIEIPAGKTKFKWTPSDKKVATVSGKAIGTVKPTTYVGDTPKSVTLTVKATGKGLKKPYDVFGTYELTVQQSNVSNISIEKSKFDGTKDRDIVATGEKKGTDKAFIGTNNKYEAIAEPKEFSSSIGWTISGSAATIDDNGNLVPVKPGKATVSANYVTVKNGKGKLNKKTITVTVVQNATSIAFAKEQTVKNPSPKNKEQTVTLKVKSIAPKKATCNVVGWKTLAHINEGDGKPEDKPNQSVPIGGTSEFIKKATKNSVTIKIPANAKAGSVIKVGAYTDGGVVAYAYVYVTEKTEKLTAEKTMVSVELGKKEPLGNFTIDKNKTKNFNQKDLTFNETGTNGSTTAYITEPVTYSVDKNSAKYIKVDQDGNVIGLQRTGNKKATVTVKTISGKSAKIKVTVN